MMNRERRRQIERQLKKKLTDEQFLQLRNEVIQKSVEDKVSRMWEIMSGELIQIMRRHRISEERVAAICTEFHDIMIHKFGEGKEDEGLSKCSGTEPTDGFDVHTSDDGECEV